MSHERVVTYHEQYRTPPQLVGTVGFSPLPDFLTVSPCSVNFYAKRFGQGDSLCQCLACSKIPKYFPDLNSMASLVAYHTLPLRPLHAQLTATISPTRRQRSSLYIPKQKSPRDIKCHSSLCHSSRPPIIDSPAMLWLVPDDQ